MALGETIKTVNCSVALNPAVAMWELKTFLSTKQTLMSAGIAKLDSPAPAGTITEQMLLKVPMSMTRAAKPLVQHLQYFYLLKNIYSLSKTQLLPRAACSLLATTEFLGLWAHSWVSGSSFSRKPRIVVLHRERNCWRAGEKGERADGILRRCTGLKSPRVLPWFFQQQLSQPHGEKPDVIASSNSRALPK